MNNNNINENTNKENLPFLMDDYQSKILNPKVKRTFERKALQEAIENIEVNIKNIINVVNRLSTFVTHELLNRIHQIKMTASEALETARKAELNNMIAVDSLIQILIEKNITTQEDIKNQVDTIITKIKEHNASGHVEQNGQE